MTVCGVFKNSNFLRTFLKMGTGKSTLRSCSTSEVDSGNNAEDAVTKDVCAEQDLKDGEMKEFSLGHENSKVLLVKQDGKFCAFGPKCTHYGAPLSKGALKNGQIICPWHGACFNSTTGDIEDHPGLDSLPKYQVNVEDGRVIVTTQKEALKTNKRSRIHASRDKSNDRVYVVLGGGGAASACVEELRYKGFQGRIIMATQESFLPYDRPKISKALDSTGEKLMLRSEEFYKSLDIEILLDKKAIEVNADTKDVIFSGGESIHFDKLVLATGGTPRKHAAPGNDLKNVCYLRSPLDANLIAENGRGKNVVVVGNSFISMEVAAYFAEKANSVSIVARSAVPFLPSLGLAVGQRIKELFETKERIKFYDEKNVKEFRGTDGVLNGVLLDDGTFVDADVCIIGIGVTPSTDYLNDSSIDLTTSNHVSVNEFLQSSDPDIYAAGDIANFPLPLSESKVNIGHWQLAQYHGQLAASNMVDNKTKVDTVPFFWCMIFGKSIRFAGYNHGFNDVIIDGDLKNLKFAAYYLKDDVVVGVASVNMDPVCAKFSAIMKSGKSLKRSDLDKDSKEWMN